MGPVNDRSPGARPGRPARLGPAALETFAGGSDPAERTEAAHATAAALVHGGRRRSDPDVTARLVALVEDHGLDAVADLWADSAPGTLPGALWRLYLLRTWVHRDAVGVSRDYDTGRRRAPVHDVVAGVAEPPGPQEVKALADAVLTGVFDGDLDIALERAAAFCRVVALGRALTADDVELGDPRRAGALTRRAGSLLRTAEQLEGAAVRWRAGDLA